MILFDRGASPHIMIFQDNPKKRGSASLAHA
jgi:hypothetical protein